MEERVLVYQNKPEYENHIRHYQFWKGELQKIADGLSELGVEPTTEVLKRAIKGEDFRHMIAETVVSDSFKTLPKRMRQTIEEMHQQETEEDYMRLVGAGVKKIIFAKNSGKKMPNFSYYYMEDGTVHIKHEYIEDAERLYCVFIDSPARKAVYDAANKFLVALKELENVLADAPKVPDTPNGGLLGAFQRSNADIKALTRDGFSIFKLWDGGIIEMEGYNFQFIQ